MKNSVDIMNYNLMTRTIRCSCGASVSDIALVNAVPELREVISGAMRNAAELHVEQARRAELRYILDLLTTNRFAEEAVVYIRAMLDKPDRPRPMRRTP